MFFCTVYKSGQIFLPFCHNTRVWRTDGRTEFSSQYRVCITCSAVKTAVLYWVTSCASSIDHTCSRNDFSINVINEDYYLMFAW